MGAPRSPITVAEFANPPGQLVFATFPVHRLKLLQKHLRKLLEQVVEPRGYAVDTEFPYRPLPDHEVWGADVAASRLQRYNAIAKWLVGSPEPRRDGNRYCCSRRRSSV